MREIQWGVEMNYDNSNILAKIIRGKIPCKKVLEDEYVLAIHDEFPKAPVHILIMPKGEYKSFTDFSARASDEEALALFRAVGKVIKEMKLAKDGYRVISNAERFGGQEIYHFHLHVLGGCPLGPMLAKPA
jgi:histidine triad (HIT) family protein